MNVCLSRQGLFNPATLKEKSKREIEQIFLDNITPKCQRTYKNSNLGKQLARSQSVGASREELTFVQ